MIYKPTLASRIFDGILVIIMLSVITVTIIPFLNVVALSFSGSLPVSLGKVTILPKSISLESYMVIFKDSAIWISYRNSIMYAVLASTFGILVNSMLAYPLSIKTYGLRGFTTVILAITMFFSGGMVPTYIVVSALGLVDTIWVMFIPFSISAFNVFVLRTFYLSIPDSLRESARIDGANEIYILFRIILPLSKPVLAVILLWSIIGTWNDFITPLIYLLDSNKYPLQIFLRRILYQFSEDMNFKAFLDKAVISPVTVQSAAIIVTILPIVCIYPFLQKYFTKGIMIGSIKG